MATTVTVWDKRRSAWDRDGARPVRCTVWWPPPREDASPPVAVLSHGTGGSVQTLHWIADGLAAAGWIVLGIDHHGNTNVEPYLAQGFAFMWERPRDVTIALNWLAHEHGVAVSDVLAVGYSLGGYTVAALAGARLDAVILSGVLSGTIPVPPLPEYPHLIEDLAATYAPREFEDIVGDSASDVSDERVSRIVLLAPAIGPLVAPESLARITVPCLVMWGSEDQVATPHENALVYLAGIPTASGRETGPYGHDIYRSDVDETPAAVQVRDQVLAHIVGFGAR